VSDGARPAGCERTLRRLLWLGVALRLAVGVCLAPANNDPHIEFLQFLSDHGRLPFGGEIYISFHPPLYYLVVAPIWFATHSAKAVQVFSVALSLANLWLIHGFLARTALIASDRGRVQAMALVALLPQFVLFSSFLSNDPPAYLIGTSILVLALAFAEAPTRGRVAGLGLAVGIGLLTKGTAIAFLPLLAGLVFAVGLRARWRVAEHVRCLALFTAVAGTVGCYKFVENYEHFGVPILSTDEVPQPWIAKQQPTYLGLRSLVDVNVGKLVREPELSRATKHSIPLLFYGTFWYSHIRESNFDHTRAGPWDFLPRTIYALAVVPTLLMLLGIGLAAARTLRLLRVFSLGEAEWRRVLGTAVALGALLGQLGLVLAWGFEHDGWSFFQSRLVFAAFPSIALTLAWGLDAAAGGRPRLGRVLSVLLVCVHLAGTAWLVVEMSYELLGA